MKYVLLFCGTDEDAQRFASLSPDELRANYARVGAWWQEHHHKIVGGEQLQPPQSATTVRRTLDGKEVVTDGPYIEAKEQIGGFDILECADLDEALEVASKHPVARYGSIEVRPFREL